MSDRRLAMGSEVSRLLGAVDFQEQGCNMIFIGRIAILPAHLILFSPFLRIYHP
jgi:hypothetical protein